MDNKKKLCLVASMVLLGTVCTVYAQNSIPETAIVQDENIKVNKETYEKAIEAINKKDFQSAIVYLTAYINSKPRKYEAYKYRGDAFYALRQYNLAKNDYQTAVDLKAADDKFMTNTKYISAVVLGADKTEQLQNPELGVLYSKLMYAQKALNDNSYELSYAKAVEYNSHIYLPQPKKNEISQINCPQKYGKILNPEGVDVYIYGAIEDIEKENYRDAVFKSQYVISNYPEYYMGYYLNGVALEGLEKEDDAIIAFENALKKNPYDFESMASLGNIYFDKAQTTFSQEDARKSISYFNQALKYNKNCYLYYFYIGMNELQLGNVDVAILNFNKAVKLKTNDYNSLYYKLIAQYIKGDYPEVLDGATKLLYKRVSNYNSVLYLRALTNYKKNDFEKSVADLDTILSNINDIYNADVRVLSSKEKTLENYVYYLKALIDIAMGDGAKSDLEKAYQNPIIAQLDKAKNALKPYEQILSKEKLTTEDYNKFKAFYETGFVKLLSSGAIITVEDIDNQYDYIRTTFDDMGLCFVYKNPDYQLTTIKDYPYKKYYFKLSESAVEQLEASQETRDDVAKTIEATPEVKLKTTTSQEDTLASVNESSLAQMLATNSLLDDSSSANKGDITVPDNVKQEVVNDTVEKEKPSAINEENAENLKKIIEEENKTSLPVTEKQAQVDPSLLPKVDPEIEKDAEIITLKPAEPQNSEIPDIGLRPKVDIQQVSEKDLLKETKAAAKEFKMQQKAEKLKAREELKLQKVQQKEQAKILKQQQNEQEKLEKEQVKLQKAKEKELLAVQKAQSKAESKAEREKKAIEKAAQKEALKVQRALETVDKAVNDKQEETKEVKKTIIKQLPR
ncbi:hypothetical protein IJ579_00205 [bacterium]|nr:hypothetical protein [bacterium]